MKRLTISVLILCVMAAIPTAAQQKLGDVAGSIKLKKSEGEAVVIDDAQMGRRSRSASSGAGESSLLYDVMGDCLEVSRSLAAVLSDAPRISPLVYSEDFRAQLEEIGLQLESVSGGLRMIPDTGAYEDAYQQAVVGLEQVQQGFSSAQVAVGANRVVNKEVREQVSAGADAIETAMTAARAVERAEAAVAPAPPIDPIAAASSIRTVCLRMGAEGSEAYQSCVSQQNAAVDALYSRSGASVGLDEASFNKIRNGCRFEWPDNYYNRNACETRRAASTSGGS
jgi:hypothetical protein